MKLAVVAGGWHWPLHFFFNLSMQASGADLFVLAHRSPELPIVREEKTQVLQKAEGWLGVLDRFMYFDYPTVESLRNLGWNYSEEPNTVGDWGFFNQWLARHKDFQKYDVILNCHDDTYFRDNGLFERLAGDWLILANGRYPTMPAGYVRGSFEFWKPELLDMLGGQIDLGNVKMTREGKTDSPDGMKALSSWNKTGVPLRNFMVKRGLENRIQYLSDFYRISHWVIEGERGFLHYREGARASYEAGLKNYYHTDV